MSHLRSVKTKMRDLKVVHDVLVARGYQPQCLSTANYRVPLEEAAMLKIPPEQISAQARGRYSIRFELNKDGEVVTKTDTDIFKTGRNSAPELVNRAGGGINHQFENEITADWAIATAIQTGVLQGFTLSDAAIVRDGNKVRIEMWRMPSVNTSTASVKSSNTVVL